MGLWVGKSWRKVASSTRSRMILLSGCSSSDDFLTSSSTATLYFHPLVVYDFRPILHQNGRSRETRSLIVLMKNEPKSIISRPKSMVLGGRFWGSNDF